MGNVREPALRVPSPRTNAVWPRSRPGGQREKTPPQGCEPSCPRTPALAIRAARCRLSARRHGAGRGAARVVDGGTSGRQRSLSDGRQRRLAAASPVEYSSESDPRHQTRFDVPTSMSIAPAPASENSARSEWQVWEWPREGTLTATSAMNGSQFSSDDFVPPGAQLREEGDEVVHSYVLDGRRYLRHPLISRVPRERRTS